MALMIVRETSGQGEREYELNREHIRAIIDRTGLNETAIYTILSAGRPIEHGDVRWMMVRQ